MQTKWYANLLGLNIFAAILSQYGIEGLEELYTMHPLSAGVSAFNGILMRTIVLHGQPNCTDCSFNHAMCDLGSCTCESGYVKLNSQCFKKADLNQYCEYDVQCSVGKCKKIEDCRCNFGAGKSGFCEFNDPIFVSPTGMMKVVMVITGCVLITTVTCVITVLYRRVRPRIVRRVSMLDLRDAVEDGVNPVPSIDTPPLYEEVIKSGPTTPVQVMDEPPSYFEYLEHQRNSLQPIIETFNSRTRVSTTRMNESFLGRF